MTDVICIILGVLFGLVLFIIAVCVYSRPNLKRASYPVDSKGVVCQIDAVKQGKQYPFLYFDDISNPNNGRYFNLNEDTVFRIVLSQEYPYNVSMTVQ